MAAPRRSQSKLNLRQRSQSLHLSMKRREKLNFEEEEEESVCGEIEQDSVPFEKTSSFRKTIKRAKSLVRLLKKLPKLRLTPKKMKIEVIKKKESEVSLYALAMDDIEDDDVADQQKCFKESSHMSLGLDFLSRKDSGLSFI